MIMKSFLYLILFIFVTVSCKDKNELETGTEFPEEFLGVWNADTLQSPDNDGIFVSFEKDTVTFIGRVGEADDPFCYLIFPIYVLIEYEGSIFTIEVLGAEEETLGELTIELDGNVMEWVISKNDTDRWFRSDHQVDDLTPVCEEQPASVSELTILKRKLVQE